MIHPVSSPGSRAKRLRTQIIALTLIAVFANGCGTTSAALPVATPTQSPNPTPSPTASPSPTPSPTPSPVPTPTPVPTLRPVTLKPAQVIIPLGEFPITGYKVIDDGARGASTNTDFTWYRRFGPFSPADYYWVSVTVYIYSSATTARERFLANATTCVYGHPDLVPASSVELTAPSSGELVHACIFHFTGNSSDVYTYETLTRNVLITVGDNPRLRTITDATAISTLADVAKKQIEILERVAPR